MTLAIEIVVGALATLGVCVAVVTAFGFYEMTRDDPYKDEDH